MANVTLLGASYANVPAVQLPQTGGGTATFYEVTGSQTITTNGTYDVSALAQAIVNVAGGGGSGLTYETGTYTPTADASHPTISFTNSHTEAPTFCFIVTATTGGVDSTNSAIQGIYFDSYKFKGKVATWYSTSATRYGCWVYAYRGTGTSTSSSHIWFSYSSDDPTDTSTSYPKYYATNQAFKPYTGSNSRYFRKDVSYKWIAIWT